MHHPPGRTVDPEVLAEVARDRSPWLFSEDGERWLALVDSMCEDATPMDVMNVVGYMGLRRRDKREPPKPGDDLALQLLSSRWESDLLRNPVSAILR